MIVMIKTMKVNMEVAAENPVKKKKKESNFRQMNLSKVAGFEVK